MPEFLITRERQPEDPELAGKDNAALEAMLDAFDPSADELPPEPAPEAPTEDVAAAEPEPTPVEEAAPVAEVAPSEEIDLSASEREGELLARERMQAELDMLKAHNSRLAGKLGFVEQQLKSTPRASEPYEPQSPEEIDRLTQLERRQYEFERQQTEIQVSQAINDGVGALDGPWIQDLAGEIAAIAPKYADQIRAAQETTDPALARQIATAVATGVKAEAMQMRWEANHKSLVEKKASTSEAALKAKKAAAPSGSGSVSPPPTKPTSLADMSAEDADRWLKANVR